MDKTYKFKFYNRYIITLRDSKHIGRRALKEKAKAIVDSKIRVNDAFDQSFFNLNNALSKTSWQDLNNSTHLLEQAAPLVKSAEAKFERTEQIAKLKKYVNENIQDFNLQDTDIYNPATINAARERLSENNGAYESFVKVIKNSNARKLYKEITETIHEYGIEYLHRNIKEDWLDDKVWDELAKEFKKANSKLESPVNELKQKITQLKEQLKSESTDIVKILEENGSLEKVKKYLPADSDGNIHVDVLNNDECRTVRAILNKVQQFDLRLERAINPYQVQAVSNALREAWLTFRKVTIPYFDAREAYINAATETYSRVGAYQLLLDLKDKEDEKITKEDLNNKAHEWIDQFPSIWSELEKLQKVTNARISGLDVNDPVNYDDFEYSKHLDEYMEQWTKKAREYRRLKPNEKLQYNFTAAESEYIAEDVQSQLTAAPQNKISQAMLKKALRDIDQAHEEFNQLQSAYRTAYQDYKNAYEAYQAVAQPAIQNYSLRILAAPAVLEDPIQLSSYNQLVRKIRENNIDTNESPDVKESDAKRQAILEAYKFFDGLRDDINQILAGDIDSASDIPDITTIKEFVAWVKKKQLDDETVASNNYISDIILPAIEDLSDSKTSKDESVALHRIPHVLNQLLVGNSKDNILFSDKFDLSKKLNAPVTEGSDFTLLDEFYDALQAPITEDEKTDESGEPLTTLDIKQNRAIKWLNENLGNGSDLATANPYVDALVYQVLFPYSQSARMTYGPDKFKSIVNTYLYEGDQKTNNTKVRHKSSYKKLVDAYKKNAADIKADILDPAFKELDGLKNNPAQQRKRFQELLPNILERMKEKISKSNVYARKVANGSVMNSPDDLQQAWIDGIFDILFEAAKEKNDINVFINDILPAVFDDTYSASVYNDVKKHLQAAGKIKAGNVEERNISNALQDFLTSPEADHWVEKIDQGTAKPGEFVAELIKVLTEKKVIADEHSENLEALYATKRFVSHLQSILSGSRAVYHQDITKNQSTLQAVWQYLVNYVRQAQGLYSVATKLGWTRPPERFNEENNGEATVVNAPKQWNARRETNHTHSLSRKAFKKDTIPDSMSDKHCLACSGVLKYYKDSELYECPMCHIVYSKSMLK